MSPWILSKHGFHGSTSSPALPGFFCFRNGAIFSGAQHPSWTVSWLRGKWPCMQTRSERVLPHPDDPCDFGAKSVRISGHHTTPGHKEKPPQTGVSSVWRCLVWWSWREPILRVSPSAQTLVNQRLRGGLQNSTTFRTGTGLKKCSPSLCPVVSPLPTAAPSLC